MRWPTITSLNNHILYGTDILFVEDRGVEVEYPHEATDIDVLVDTLLYPLAEDYVKLTKSFQERNRDILEGGVWDGEDFLTLDNYVLTQADRWWFHANIKPILEEMIAVWDIFYRDYEPY